MGTSDVSCVFSLIEGYYFYFFGFPFAAKFRPRTLRRLAMGTTTVITYPPYSYSFFLLDFFNSHDLARAHKAALDFGRVRRVGNQVVESPLHFPALFALLGLQ